MPAIDKALLLIALYTGAVYVVPTYEPDYYTAYLDDLGTGDDEDWDDYIREPMSPIHKPHWMQTHAS